MLSTQIIAFTHVLLRKYLSIVEQVAAVQNTFSDEEEDEEMLSSDDKDEVDGQVN